MTSIIPETEVNTIADLREVLFCIYDSVSCLAGGRETSLPAELSLLECKVNGLVKQGVLHPLDKEMIVPNFIKAVREQDGEQAHFYSRMIFRETVDILKEKAQKES